jgi:hypothetical protein
VPAPVDWGAPWFAPLRSGGEPVLQRWSGGLPLHAALDAGGAAPIRFVAQSALPPEVPYERYLFESGCCPTRENLHDFFNGLIWRHYPQAKRRLNALQAAQIAVQGAGAQRGPVRDAITLFDENGALLDAPAPLWEALLARNWQRLFVDLRPLWSQARVRVFGHALLEKLLAPRKEITAHVWARQCPMNSTAEVDGWLAGQFTAGCLAGKPFTPLPVLGIPGWWAENENFSFYDDSLVFRQPAGKTLKTTGPSIASRT